MALLPPEKMGKGVEVIHSLIDKNFASDKKIKNRWQRYMRKYFKAEWMGKVGPEVFSVYNLVDRTNNYLESLHSWYWTKMHTCPSVFKFLCEYHNHTL